MGEGEGARLARAAARALPAPLTALAASPVSTTRLSSGSPSNPSNCMLASPYPMRNKGRPATNRNPLIMASSPSMAMRRPRKISRSRPSILSNVIHRMSGQHRRCPPEHAHPSPRSLPPFGRCGSAARTKDPPGRRNVTESRRGSALMCTAIPPAVPRPGPLDPPGRGVPVRRHGGHRAHGQRSALALGLATRTGEGEGARLA